MRNQELCLAGRSFFYLRACTYWYEFFCRSGLTSLANFVKVGDCVCNSVGLSFLAISRFLDDLGFSELKLVVVQTSLAKRHVFDRIQFDFIPISAELFSSDFFSWTYVVVIIYGMKYHVRDSFILCCAFFILSLFFFRNKCYCGDCILHGLQSGRFGYHERFSYWQGFVQVRQLSLAYHVRLRLLFLERKSSLTGATKS